MLIFKHLDGIKNIREEKYILHESVVNE